MEGLASTSPTSTLSCAIAPTVTPAVSVKADHPTLAWAAQCVQAVIVMWTTPPTTFHADVSASLLTN
jgi:hypothetical protein